MPRRRSKEAMAAYQRQRRANVTPRGGVTNEGGVTEIMSSVDVTPARNVTPDVTPAIVLSDGQVYHLPIPDSSLEPSKAYPRQPNRCIRCGARIPATDNFCSDPHYREHLAWLEARQEGQERASDGKGGMITPRILELKRQLEDLKAQYTIAQKQQDWPVCSQVNAEREPVMKELFKLTDGAGYWFPARF